MRASKGKTDSVNRYPCHCCRKKDTVSWSEKRQGFVCDNCQKVFDRAVIARRNGVTAEQLSLC